MIVEWVVLSWVFMALNEYRKKRDFYLTAEPRGQVRRAPSGIRRRFVIQKHAASRLHYDFRLEIGGVLKSWAVPKGPSLNPGQKRLAVAVEDHPLEYGDFEGTIPAGQYGGGTVMLWDRGTWEPEGDPQQAYQAGKLHFTLQGEKLRGEWILVRRGGSKALSGEKNWFLFKADDDEADPTTDILETQSKSVVSNRTMDGIGAAKDRIWNSRPESNGKPSKRKPSSATRSSGGASTATVDKPPPQRGSRASIATPAVKNGPAKASRKQRQPTADLARLLRSSAAKRGPLPEFVQPQLAGVVSNSPHTKDWIHEVKFDGYRMLCRVADGRATFVSRNALDWTNRLGRLAEAAAELPLEQALLDGEVVSLLANGLSSFQSLQNAFRDGRTGQLVYYVFDVLQAEGYNLAELPLTERKKILAAMIPQNDGGPIRLTEYLEGAGPTVFEQACKLGLEGIISKRQDRPYRSGRGFDWVKSKCLHREEFVIGGFSAPAESRHGFGALLLGYYDRRQRLVFAGRVGTGFSDKTLADLHRQLDKLAQKASPFENLSGRTGPARDVTWVQPELVAQVEFSNWTDDGLLRHPAFLGLREDKPARQIVRDRPAQLLAPTTAPMPKLKPASRRRREAATPPSAGKRTTSPRETAVGKSAAKNTVCGILISHPDKVLYPDQGITKRELAEYYEAVAEWMLPHMTNRPLSLLRCPEGTGGQCFFQKHPGPGAFPTLRRIPIREKSKTEDYLVVDDAAGLVALAQMGVLEIHAWGSRADHVENPDRLIFDLDPDPAVAWARVLQAARRVRELLEGLGLKSWVKTTGGKGLHVVVPIQPSVAWSEAKMFCGVVAKRLVADDPDRYIATMSKAARKGKIFIDYLRNDRGATSVAPYSTRARENAPVSVPLAWDELTSRLKSDRFNIRNLRRRLDGLQGDPWKELLRCRQTLEPALRKLSTEG